MGDRPHIIKRQVLDVKFITSKTEDGYHDLLKEVYYNKIVPKLEKIIDGYSHADTLIRIDSLEIDIGNIPVHSINNEFPLKVGKAFEEKLKQIVGGTGRSDDISFEVVPLKQSALEILKFFLLTGDLPWHITSKQDFSIDHLLSEIQNSNPSELRSLLESLSYSTDIIKRIQAQFSQESLNLIGQIIGSPETVLAFFIENGELPWWIADNSGLSINELLTEFHHQNPAKLKKILYTLPTNSNVNDKLKKHFEKQSLPFVEEQLNTPLYVMGFFLKTGELPWWINDKKRFNIHQLLIEIHRQNPTELRNLFLGISEPNIIRRILSQFKKESLSLIEELLRSPLSELGYFLKTGELPWWIIDKRTFDLNAIIREFIEKNPAELLHLITGITEPETIKRLQLNLHIDIIKSMDSFFASPQWILEYYFKNEGLPWWISDKSKVDIDNMIQDQYKLNQSELLLLFKTINSDDFINTISTKLNSETTDLISEILQSALPGELLKIYDDLKGICISASLINITEHLYHLSTLPLLYQANRQHVTPQLFLEELIFLIAKLKQVTVADLCINIFFHFSGSADPADFANSLKSYSEKPEVILSEKIKTLITTPLFSRYQNLIELLLTSYYKLKAGPSYNYLTETSANIADISKSDKENKLLKRKPEIKSEIKESFIDNAGLVILWPYLAKFFDHLNYTQNGTFINNERQQRAIHMLQYLVWGKEISPEYQLLLNKLFCGYDILAPIELKVKFKRNEKQAAEELLEAVVKNWPVLKSTSINGFRQAFLQRNGMINIEDDGWKLKVEQKAYDMLLETLSWSISIVKLPWMKQILYVEW